MLYVVFLFLVEKIKKRDVMQIKFVFLILNFRSEILPKNRISRKRALSIGSFDIKVLTSLIIFWIYGQSQKMCNSVSFGAGRSRAYSHRLQVGLKSCTKCAIIELLYRICDEKLKMKLFKV